MTLINQDKPLLLIDLINQGFNFLDGIFDNITNGIVITDEHSNIIYVNHAVTVITGYKQQELLNKNPGILHSGRHDKKFYASMWHSINNDGYWSGEIWNRSKSGKLLPEWITITKISNQEKIYYISVFSDITSLINKNKEKINLAYIDPLTNIYNRSYLDEAFKFYCTKLNRRAKEGERGFTILFMDVNNFKSINDQYGHLAGDSVLNHIANVIKDNLRDVDIVLRYGGDEFIAILDNIDSDDIIENITQRIANKLKVPLVYEDKLIGSSISMGGAIYPQDSRELDKLIKYADEAMYNAKRNKRSLVFYK